MKRLIPILGIILICVFAFTACSNEPELTEHGREVMALREKYHDKIVGEWYVERIFNTSKDYATYDFKKDGTLNVYHKWTRRDSSIVNGQVVYGDWDTKDQTEAYNKWILSIKQEDNKPYLAFISKSGNNSAVQEIHDFDFANENILVMQTWYYDEDNGRTVLKRGNPGASF